MTFLICDKCELVDWIGKGSILESTFFEKKNKGERPRCGACGDGFLISGEVISRTHYNGKEISRHMIPTYDEEDGPYYNSQECVCAITGNMYCDCTCRFCWHRDRYSKNRLPCSGTFRKMPAYEIHSVAIRTKLYFQGYDAKVVHDCTCKNDPSKCMCNCDVCLRNALNKIKSFTIKGAKKRDN